MLNRYNNHEKDGTPDAMLNTYRRFVEGEVKHASPLEHQLTPMGATWSLLYPQLRSNCAGWLQARKLLPNERCLKYDPSDEEIASWGLDQF